MILKNPYELEAVQNVFENSSIKIPTAGKRHLGAALGSQEFKKEYISEKVDKWMTEIVKLSEIAESQPQAAYSAFVHGYQHKFRYFLRTLKDIKDELRPLDDLITNTLIPAFVGFQLSDMDRELFSLPVRLGGMGIEQISSIADEEYARSKQIAALLDAIIAIQGNFLSNPEDIQSAKSEALKQKSESLKVRSAQLDEALPNDVQRNLIQARKMVHLVG